MDAKFCVKSQDVPLIFCINKFCVQKACEILGFSGELTGTFGGSDNNSFAKNGIEGLVLSNGMYNAHSTREYTTVDDLYKGAELIGQLILL